MANLRMIAAAAATVVVCAVALMAQQPAAVDAAQALGPVPDEAITLAQTATETETGAEDAPVASGPEQVVPAALPNDPNRGDVTNLPLPRYVTLKTGEGNARRGPGLSHRIDWVFTRVGMPLRVTAEHGHWRRVEDAEGAGGWVHYALLSGVRSVLVAQDMAELRTDPNPEAPVVLKAEVGVVARLVECAAEWCRLNVEGDKGWVQKIALWGVEPGEVLE